MSSVAVDYQRINYSGVPSIGNPSTNRAQLGSANGPGFGWKDVGVFKLGVQWQATPKLALRAGYNKSQNPIEGRDVTFNILAPGVITSHVTLGGGHLCAVSFVRDDGGLYACAAAIGHGASASIWRHRNHRHVPELLGTANRLEVLMRRRSGLMGLRTCEVIG